MLCCSRDCISDLLAGSCPLPLGCRNIQYLVKILLTACCTALQCKREQLQLEGQRAWGITPDLLGGASSSKLRFKSSGDARNAAKSFEISINQILIFNLNKYTVKSNTIFSALRYSRFT